jgi:ankyrin repeat protein
MSALPAIALLRPWSSERRDGAVVEKARRSHLLPILVSPPTKTSSVLRDEEQQQQQSYLNEGNDATKEHDNNCKILLELIVRQRWQFAEKQLDRLLDSDWDGHDGSTLLLSQACRRKPPARFVRKLIRKLPEAVLQADESNNLPLHYACRENASLDVLKELLVDYPETAAGVTRAVQVKASLSPLPPSSSSPAIPADHGPSQSPMAALWQGRNTSETSLNYETRFWQKMELLLQSIAKSRRKNINEDGMLYILHAAVSTDTGDLPLQVWDYILSQYEDQASITDHYGRLPLHYAALARAKTEYSEVSLAAKYKPRQEQLLYRLVKTNPEAARILDPLTRRYPLHTALANGHVWHAGVQELFDAAPEVVGLEVPVHRLMPCQLSQDINTIYKLVRAYPSVVRVAPPQLPTSTSHKGSNVCGNSGYDDDKENRCPITPGRPSTKLGPSQQDLRLGTVARVSMSPCAPLPISLDIFMAKEEQKRRQPSKPKRKQHF